VPNGGKSVHLLEERSVSQCCPHKPGNFILAPWVAGNRSADNHLPTEAHMFLRYAWYVADWDHARTVGA